MGAEFRGTGDLLSQNTKQKRVVLNLHQRVYVLTFQALKERAKMVAVAVRGAHLFSAFLRRRFALRWSL